jgi:hypothetical protein
MTQGTLYVGPDVHKAPSAERQQRAEAAVAGRPEIDEARVSSTAIPPSRSR